MVCLIGRLGSGFSFGVRVPASLLIPGKCMKRFAPPKGPMEWERRFGIGGGALFEEGDAARDLE